MITRTSFYGTLLLGMPFLFSLFSCKGDQKVVLVSYPEDVVSYREDTTSIFCNPERGWQKTFNPDYETNVQYPVYTREELTDLRKNEKITLVDKYYTLMPYKTSDIPQDYLNDFQRDMDLLRETGLKAIVRFAYNFAGDKDMSDAPVDWILKHIQQLKPLLQDNYDVIAIFEAGFIGKWAEWHGSQDNLGGKWHIDVNENTRKIYDAIMDAVPKDRMVAIRYIHQILTLTGMKTCENNSGTVPDFPEQEAFSGSNIARTGRHDDWVFGDAGSNMGTWSTDLSIRECQKSYLEELSKYVPITTGETQTLSDFGRENSPIPFFERFHFASLSINPGEGAEAPIRLWKSNGTFDEISRRFGYRFVLKEASIPEIIDENDNLSFSFKIENKGFGGVYNPRLFEVVLRNTESGEEHHFDLTHSRENKLDPRFWFRENGIMEKEAEISLADVPSGSYQMFLHLPDPTEKLYGRPEFSIRLANENMWEEETGYNDLNHTLTIK